MSVDTTFESFTAYKCRLHGVWLRGEGPRVNNTLLADNGLGMRLIGGPNSFENGVVIGESSNIGLPYPGEARSRASIPNPSKSIVGV